MVEQKDFLPDRLDKDPPFFMGLSIYELFGLYFRNLVLSAIIVIPLAIWLFGSVLYFVAGFLVSAGIAYGLTKVMAKKQREKSKGKPDGYSQHLLAIRFEKLFRKHRKFGLYIEDGKWE